MDTIIKDCAAVILAGGENTRMPTLKAFIEVKGEKIIERNLKILKGLFNEIYIVTNQPKVYSYLEIPLLGDVHDIRGPMTGIFTALLNCSNRWSFVSACDMPFINRSLIKYMTSQKQGFDAVVPVVNKKPEPLFALYSKQLAASMEKALMSENKSLRDFLNNKRVKYISSSEIRGFDPEGLSFINLNTPQDLKRYLRPEDRSR